MTMPPTTAPNANGNVCRQPLGIGATTTIFSVLHAVVLRPFPFERQDELVMIWEQDESARLLEVSFPNYRDWRRQAQSFADMAAIGSVNWSFTTTINGEPESVSYAAVSTSFFETLGVRPLLGRTFLSDEDEPDAERVLVISHGLWQRNFGLDPHAVGRSIRMTEGESSELYTVVGVMPQAFQFPNGADAWAPAGRRLADVARTQSFDPVRERLFGVLYVIGRLEPAVKLEQARSELDTIIPALNVTYFGGRESGRSVMTPLTDYPMGRGRTALFALSGAVGLILLIACANVAGLSMARAVTRERELAVRVALGASRVRLMRQAFVDAGLLGAVGGVVSLLVAVVSIGVVRRAAFADLPRVDTVAINWAVLGFTLGVSFITVILVGLAPAAHAVRSRVAGGLQAGALTLTAAPSRLALRHALVIGEVAMALMLLIGAGLLTRSFANLVRLDLGFRPENVLPMNVALPEARYSEFEQQRAFYRELLRRVERLPGVEAVGAVSLRPFEHGPIGNDIRFLIPGKPSDIGSSDQLPMANLEAVTPGYFRAMGIRLLQGRLFEERDVKGSFPVVIVSEALARAVWPGEDPLGKQLISFAPVDEAGNSLWQTVIGVVDTARYREIQTPRLDLYIPFYQVPRAVKHLIVRTDSDPLSLAVAVREEVRRLDDRQVVDGVTTMASVVARTQRPWRSNTLLFGVLAALAVVLAAIGVFGAIAYNVAQRTREFGVRLTLGARSLDLVTLVTRQGVFLTVTGAAIGLVASLALTRGLGSLLFGVSPIDPVTFGAVTLVLVAVGLLAAVVPARRAARVDPVVALRAQ